MPAEPDDPLAVHSEVSSADDAPSVLIRPTAPIFDIAPAGTLQ
jgi:hypothetical protein